MLEITSLSYEKLTFSKYKSGLFKFVLLTILFLLSINSHNFFLVISVDFISLSESDKLLNGEMTLSLARNIAITMVESRSPFITKKSAILIGIK